MMRRERLANDSGAITSNMYAGAIVIGAIIILALARGGFRGHLG